VVQLSGIPSRAASDDERLKWLFTSIKLRAHTAPLASILQSVHGSQMWSARPVQQAVTHALALFSARPFRQILCDAARIAARALQPRQFIYGAAWYGSISTVSACMMFREKLRMRSGRTQMLLNY